MKFKILFLLKCCYKKTHLKHICLKETGFTKKNTEVFVKTLIETIEKTLKANEKVTLIGFGTFELRNRAAREGRNPKTQEVIKIPATKAPAFRAGKLFKDLVNQKKSGKKKK